MGFGYKEDGIISPLTITSRRAVMLMNIDHLFHGVIRWCWVNLTLGCFCGQLLFFHWHISPWLCPWRRERCTSVFAINRLCLTTGRVWSECFALAGSNSGCDPCSCLSPLPHGFAKCFYWWSRDSPSRQKGLGMDFQAWKGSVWWSLTCGCLSPGCDLAVSLRGRYKSHGRSISQTQPDGTAVCNPASCRHLKSKSALGCLVFESRQFWKKNYIQRRCFLHSQSNIIQGSGG